MDLLNFIFIFQMRRKAMPHPPNPALTAGQYMIETWSVHKEGIWEVIFVQWQHSQWGENGEVVIASWKPNQMPHSYQEYLYLEGLFPYVIFSINQLEANFCNDDFTSNECSL